MRSLFLSVPRSFVHGCSSRALNNHMYRTNLIPRVFFPSSQQQEEARVLGTWLV